MAYGTKKINKVNKIVGPGNIFVSTAKKEVFGDVGIEGMIAGPSEIAVVADKNTNLKEVLTSLIGQAEHDINSQSILVTKNQNLIEVKEYFYLLLAVFIGGQIGNFLNLKLPGIFTTFLS